MYESVVRNVTIAIFLMKKEAIKLSKEKIYGRLNIEKIRNKI